MALGAFFVNGFYDTLESTRWVPSASIEYSTMHLRDVAIVRLDATNGELRKLGISPFALAAERPRIGDPIVIAGHPNNGPLLRSRCEQGAVHRLIEDEFLQTAVADECGALAPGSSGGPVFDAVGRIVGVVSTQTNSGHPCTSDRPCELEAPSNPTPARVNYAADVVGLGACFSAGKFDLEAPDCILTRPSLPAVERGVGRYTRSNVDGAPPRWNVAVRDRGLPYYRFKLGPAETTSCEVEEGYGDVFAAASTPTIAESVGSREGRYLLCVHGGTAADVATAFTRLDGASALVTEIDDTPPPPPLPVEIQLQPDQVTIRFAVRLPDDAKYRYRVQPVGSSACDIMADDTVVDMTTIVSVPRVGMVRDLCVAAEDSAGNVLPSQRFAIPD
jgi:hypothetical protein